MSDRSATGQRKVSPLLRWAGSKRAILSVLLQRVPASFTRYIEPFAGSACLFFSLAPRRAVLADLNTELIGFYRTLRAQPRTVSQALHSLACDESSYYEIRARDPARLCAAERAARFLYLNRMAFNGVYRTNRRGEFNVPRGRRGGAFPTEGRMVSVAGRLRSATLVAADFECVLRDVAPGDFVYLDPPYSRSPAGNYGVYGYGSFDGRDLDRLLDAAVEIDRRGAAFVLSYTDAPELTSRLSRFHVERVAVTAQVGGAQARRSTREEVLVSNPR